METTENTEADDGWYCVRTRPKAEHIAAAHLQKYALLDEVFCPRIRFEKATKRGKVWFIEALFPGYIFARFDLETQLRTVNATNAVSGVLRFGDLYPKIADSFLKELRQEFDQEEDEVRIVKANIEEGDEVIVTEGPFMGLTTLVTQYLPGQDRVRVLLEWLGQEREAEVSLDAIIPEGQARSRF